MATRMEIVRETKKTELTRDRNPALDGTSDSLLFVLIFNSLQMKILSVLKMNLQINPGLRQYMDPCN
jgi:hypothetical protein